MGLSAILGVLDSAGERIDKVLSVASGYLPTWIKIGQGLRASATKNGNADVDITIEADGGAILVSSVAEARALTSSAWRNGQEVHVATTYTIGPNSLPQIVIYAWDPTLTIADDGALVLKPNDVSGAGRLLRMHVLRTGEVYSGGGQGLSVYAGDTPPGAPNSGELNLRASSIVRIVAGTNLGVSYDGTNLGFHSATGSPRITLTASQSDAQAQINEIIAALVAFGLVNDSRVP